MAGVRSEEEEKGQDEGQEKGRQWTMDGLALILFQVIKEVIGWFIRCHLI